ncbi:MAG: hypothetical protein GY827_10680 [Cytophagales bacterium]|nr:hypothetical protein [Cytophagales bacterium]
MGYRHGGGGSFNIEVTVKRTELIERLKRNREKHQKEFKQAIKLWQKDLEKAAQSINYRKIHTYPAILEELQDECPVSFVSEYDDMIDMFEMAIKDEMILTSDAFRNFCRDEWDWKSDIAQNKYYEKVIGSK